MTAKTFQQTYPVDTEGATLGPLTPEQKASLTKRLRADAKKEGHTLGDTEFVGRTGLIGGVMDVTVKAAVAESGADAPKLNAPAGS